ncbi:MAG: hypothetical protein JW984_14150 [Deltaproteobacteria bacterium]|uniref:Uncharacterized protein n=1 Tax=Candidatus Zymogenus saltonus TaxID=2844893 RepID=A0A9D8PRP1_9DELT|nr:hypothetical protein [Candidatus Zymogenus saltonus]
MERRHKKYLIISGIVYLILCFTFKFGIIKSVPHPNYKIDTYLLLIVLVFAFIFGIRNSIRAIVIWLGIIFEDFIYHLYDAMIYIRLMELATIVTFFYLFLATVAIFYGFRSLNMNTIATDNFSKMYRKTAIIFFVCSIILFIFVSISEMERIWIMKGELPAGTLPLFIISYLLIFSIEIGVMIYAISKIMKREVLGFVFAAFLLVWRFFYYISIYTGRRLFDSAFYVIQNKVIYSNPILSFIPKFSLAFKPYILVFMFLFLLIPLTNFLFYLKRDPKIKPLKSSDVNPLSGATK